MSTRSDSSRTLRLRCIGAVLLITATSAASAQTPTDKPAFKDGLRPAPRTLLAPSTARAALPAAPTAAAALESWPLRFELAAGERTGAGFAVTRSGPIHVTLQTSGVPLVLSLLRPDGRSIERAGSGTLQIDDTASDADIQRGVLWRIGVRVQQEAKLAPAGLVRKAAAPATVAGGSLSVKHPGADPARVQAALAGAAAQAAQLQQRALPAAAPADIQQVQKQAQAQLDQEVAQRHAAALAQLRPSLPADVQSQLQQRITLRLQGQSLQQASVAAPVRLITRAGDASLAPLKLGAPGGRLLAAPAGVTGGTAAVGSAATGVAPVGSGGGAATAVAPPQLASTSVGQGDPGTPVSVAGSSFGDAPGEVRFIVGNGRDVAAPVTYWSAAQIVTEVPYADGLPVYDGQVYVKRADGQRSALRPFRFLPVYDVAAIGLPVPRMEWKTYTFDSAPAQQLSVSRMIDHGDMGNPFHLIFGDSGYVQYYQTTRLKNGWLVDGAALTSFGTDGPYLYNSAGAYITELRAGTDSPFVKVRWWRDAGSKVAYDLRISVKRPRALPCANPCAVL